MKLRNKLILSCAALAAVATTAVSTTFAWYTANTEVSATGITAKTKSAAAETLLISKTGVQKTWKAKVDLEMTIGDDGTLIPVAWDGTNNVYKSWDSTDNEAKKAHVDGNTLKFMLYFNSGSEDNLDVKMTHALFKNTTEGTLPTKTVQTTTGLGSGAGDATYNVNMFRALVMAVNPYQTKEVKTGTPTYTFTAANRQVYALGKAMDANAKADSWASTFDGNAHEYYDEIKGLVSNSTAATNDDPIATTTEGTRGYSEAADATLAYKTAATVDGELATSYKIGETGVGGAANGAVDNILAVRFDIYLDGWNKACFDACQGQTFTLTLQFASDVNEG